VSARSRKKGQRKRPNPGTRKRAAPVTTATAAPAAAPSKPASRSQARDAAARETLEPLQPGERPWPIVASVIVTTALGLANFTLFAAGVKPHVSGQKPQLPEILIFTGLMLLCAWGMWRLRYWAVLGFETLLAIGLLGFSLALIKVESVFWAIACCAIIGVFGYLFWKLVRVMGRIQMPTPPSRNR
jgi:hypothetical protein